MKSTNYLRPYLLPEELNSLVALLNQEHGTNGLDKIQQSVFHKLSKLQLNASIGLTKPVVITRQNTLIEKLELDGPIKQDSGAITNEQKLERAYHKWVNMPGLCTEQDIEDAQSYRMAKGLMEEEELVKYQEELMGKFNF
jgi:hypothetical protein